MFRLWDGRKPLTPMRRMALVTVLMVNGMVAIALLLFLTLGCLGLFYFLGTWPLAALVSLFLALIVTPASTAR